MQTSLNLISAIEELEKLDVQKGLEDATKTQNLQPLPNSPATCSTFTITPSLDQISTNLIDDETQELLKELAEVSREAEEDKKVVEKIEKNIKTEIEQLKSYFRVKFNS